MNETHKINDGPEHPSGPCCDRVTDLFGERGTLIGRLTAEESKYRRAAERVCDLEAKLFDAERRASEAKADRDALMRDFLALKAKLEEAEAGVLTMREHLLSAQYDPSMQGKYTQNFIAAALASDAGRKLLERVERMEEALRQMLYNGNSSRCENPKDQCKREGGDMLSKCQTCCNRWQAERALGGE